MSNAAQQEERNKRILYIVFGVLFLGVGVWAYQTLFGGAPTPPPAPAPAVQTVAGTAAQETVSTAARTQAASPAQGGLGVAPGVAARKMASTSSSLDPTLDESAMLRTESLVYTGTGRNIFSLTYVPPVVIPKVVPNPRPGPVVAAPPPQPTGPPPPPPINLKYFGTETRADGLRQAFLLQGEDVYLASQGDIVARKYKILSISPSGIQVEDLTNHNTQTLPLLAN